MLFPPMPGPTATTGVKNAAPDPASSGQATATTGFSNLLAQEMGASHNALAREAGAPGEGVNISGKASAAAAVEPDSPAAQIDKRETPALENSASTKNSVAPEGKMMPRLANASAMTHQNSVRLPAETGFKGSAKEQIENQAEECKPVNTGDSAPTRAREHRRGVEQINDRPVLAGDALQTEITARPPQQQHVDFTSIQPAPARKPEQEPGGRTAAEGTVSFAASSVNKDPVMVSGNGIPTYRDLSTDASGAPGTGGAPRQLGGVRSSSAGDKPFASDFATRPVNFRPLEPALQAPHLALEAEPLPKPVLDLSSPLQNPSMAPVEAPLGSLVAETAPTPAAAISFSGDAASLEPRLGVAGWDNALGQKVLWMVSQQQQVAELNLNPPDLGPLQVVLSIDNGEASATFVSQHADVRQALEAALPRLREMMAESGITLSSATVSQEGARQQNGFERHERPAGERVAGAHLPLSDGATGTSRISIEPGRSRLVDTFA